MSTKKVVLKQGKEKPILNRHHWIFSGAVQSLPEFVDGECLPVYSSQDELLGTGYFNRRTQIIGRMLSFGSSTPQEVIRDHLTKALALRNRLIDPNKTNAYRLINGEGDLLPGLIVDCYGDVIVIQVGTLGMSQLRPIVVKWLIDTLNPRSIYEKSLLPSRREEGLQEEQGALFGQVPAEGIDYLFGYLQTIVLY